MIQTNNRKINIDILRIFATIGVIVIHVTAPKWEAVSVDSMGYMVYTMWDSLVRWSVPIFVMISGALFLNPQKTLDVKKLYTKNIMRMVTAFVFWSAVYSAYAYIGRMLKMEFPWKEIVLKFIRGEGHLWFIFMIVGLYMVTPLLKKMIETENLLKYFLVISFMFNIVLYTVIELLPLLITDEFFTSFFKALVTNYKKAGFNLILGYSFYFVLGQYLMSHKISKKMRLVLYGFGVAGVLVTFLLVMCHTKLTDRPQGAFFGYLSLPVAMQSVAVFVFFKNMKWQPKGLVLKMILAVSKYSFGIYLVHLLVLHIVDHFTGERFETMNSLIYVPIMTVIIFAGSLMVSAVLNKIPILKKYIV